MSRRAPAPTCDPEEAADLLRALAHPMRLQILCRLLEGELAVSGFEAELGLKQPSLSQQLGQLREAKLVATRRQGKAIFYRLADARVRLILDALHKAFVGRAPKTPNRRTRTEPVKTAPPAPTTGRDGAECGVFAVAGWPSIADGTRR